MSKTITCLVTFGLFAAVFCSPGTVYSTSVHVRTTPRVTQDSKKIKNDLYNTFEKGTSGDTNARKAAYDAGKEYLQKFPDEKDPHVKVIKDWIVLYALAKVYKEKAYDEAFDAGKYVLTTDPDNVRILTALGYAGMQAAASGNTIFASDAIVHAKKAIQLIDGGKVAADWKPFTGKDETLGWLNYVLGVLVLRDAPHDAIRFLVNAAQYEGAPKKNPVVYYYLASLYSSDFEKQRSEFKTSYGGKQETPESKAALARISTQIDLIIDAYARAIAYTKANPQYQQMFQQQEAGWTKSLTELYKSRHDNSDKGLKELIAEITTKPLPGQPLKLSTSTLP